MSRRVYIESYGCQENVYDSHAITDILKKEGWEATPTKEDADLILMNTCAVRDNAEQRVLGRIGELQSLKLERDVKLGVVGCMAQRLGSALQKQKRAVDLVVGTDGYEQLPGLLDKIAQGAGAQSLVETDGKAIYSAPPQVDPLNNSHFISITRGCDYRCTYCIVPTTRGALRMKEPTDVLREVHTVVEQGGVEVTLLGQNVTAYRHADASFAELLSAVASIEGIRRVRFLTSHPTDFPEETFKAIAAHEEVSPWLHLPVQSGSDRILRRMKRGYRLDGYLGVVAMARDYLPDVSFSTDMIVGFPGETEEDFLGTLVIMETVGYDSSFLFKYSERPGTPSARLEDDVPEELKRERLQRLIAHQEKLWSARAQTFVGQEWNVAIEGEARRDNGWRARSLNNRKIVIPSDPSLAVGDEVRVRIRDVSSTTFQADSLGLIWKYKHVAA